MKYLSLMILLFCSEIVTAQPRPQVRLPDVDGDGHPLFGNPQIRTGFEEIVGGQLRIGDATSVAFADLDGDGDLDAVVTNTGGVTVFYARPIRLAPLRNGLFVALGCPSFGLLATPSRAMQHMPDARGVVRHTQLAGHLGLRSPLIQQRHRPHRRRWASLRKPVYGLPYEIGRHAMI